MNHIDLIHRNFDDRSVNLADLNNITAESSQKDNLHLGEKMKDDYSKDFMKAM